MNIWYLVNIYLLGLPGENREYIARGSIWLWLRIFQDFWRPNSSHSWSIKDKIGYIKMTLNKKAIET